jgi:hypothetical protein
MHIDIELPIGELFAVTPYEGPMVTLEAGAGGACGDVTTVGIVGENTITAVVALED